MKGNTSDRSRPWAYRVMMFIWIICWVAASGCQSDGSRKVESASPLPSASAKGSLDAVDSSVGGGSGARHIVLGYSQLGSESDWRRANTISIQEASKEAGIELVFDNAEQSQERQFQAVRSFIKQKVDIIGIAPVVESGWEPILQEAKQAGIPVIIMDRSVDVKDPSLFVTWIGSDFYAEGQNAAKYMIDKMRDAAGPIGVAELRGTDDSSPSIERGRGFHDWVARQKNVEIIESESADFTFEKGKSMMRRFLEEKGKQIRVLFAHNDDMALGAVEAIEEYGLKPGKDIVIISVDGTEKAFEQLKAGRINCVVECNPLLGPILMQAVKEHIQGHAIPERIITPESVFTESMAQEEAAKRKY